LHLPHSTDYTFIHVGQVQKPYKQRILLPIQLLIYALAFHLANHLPAMATPSTSTFVLFGSGPGIGLHVATLFAQKHFQHIILLSRDKDRLEEDAAAVRAVRPGMTVTAITCDLSKLQSVRDALAAIDQVLQANGTTLEVVCYNAARVRPTDLLTEPPEEYEKDFKVSEPNTRHSSAVF
jgi:hypothetical protein